MKLEDNERTLCEVWTRVMGYHRPVTAFNEGKQQEHLDRKKYKEPGDYAYQTYVEGHNTMGALEFPDTKTEFSPVYVYEEDH